jgi:hypothetical protein
MLLLYGVLIPSYGNMGAAVATLVGFAFLAVCTWAVTQRVFPVRYEWPRLAALLALAVLLWSLSRPLPQTRWSWPVKAGLWILAPVAVWCTGLISHREKEHVRAITGEARQRLLNGLTWSRTLRPPGKTNPTTRPEPVPGPTLIVQAGIPNGEQTAL